MALSCDSVPFVCDRVKFVSQKLPFVTPVTISVNSTATHMAWSPTHELEDRIISSAFPEPHTAKERIICTLAQQNTTALAYGHISTDNTSETGILYTVRKEEFEARFQGDLMQAALSECLPFSFKLSNHMWIDAQSGKDDYAKNLCALLVEISLVLEGLPNLPIGERDKVSKFYGSILRNVAKIGRIG